MLNLKEIIIHKYKGLNTYFATIQPDSADSPFVYISGYGRQVSDLLDKYIDDQRADNEELFARWDELIEKAKTEIGFKAIEKIGGDDKVDEEYVYITTFQNGVGISEEDEAGTKRYTTRGKKRKTKISIISPDLPEGLSQDDDLDLSEEIEEADLSDDDE
jgi:hypothetical protein